MEQLIRLLPDNIANQIAAGEVVQRPASVVKELMENAIDAGATRIDLVIKDAGKALIQVTDNGSGMNAQDARMCFERHATSKIRTSGDLFNIRTMGFRGEAMASIAAVAQVHMLTRMQGHELGTEIAIEGNEIKRAGPVMCAQGTTVSAKNLFFNVPARRNFLKSNPVETRHILNEFMRVALPHPEIGYRFEHNGHLVYDLAPTTLDGRIVQLFGKDLDSNLLHINEETPYVAIGGFIGSPESAKHKKGEQYFFVNRRFIKSHYLHHAISTAFDGLLPAESQPFYFVFFDIEPSHIDINIHPTKTEIKFDDERTVYALLHSVIRKALGAYHRAPLQNTFVETSQDHTTISDLIKRSPLPPLDDFKTVGHAVKQKESPGARWDDFYSTKSAEETHVKPYEAYIPREKESPPVQTQAAFAYHAEQSLETSVVAQVENKYVMLLGAKGLFLIDQHAAHQRILFEAFLHANPQRQISSQQLLFPQTFTFSALEYSFVSEIMDELHALGFDLRDIGNHTVLLHGLPDIMKGAKAEQFFQTLIAELKADYDVNPQQKLSDLLARSIAMKSAIPSGKRLTQDEMRALCQQLFACEEPARSPSGRPTFYKVDMTAVDQYFHP